jgi:hypothetical protein
MKMNIEEERFKYQTDYLKKTKCLFLEIAKITR